MADDDEHEMIEGAASFPPIPPELGVHPLLLAVIHATVFLAGSDEPIVDGEAAGEVIDAMGSYLQQLRGADLERVKADLQTLLDFARAEKWPKQEQLFLKSFLADFGVSGE